MDVVEPGSRGDLRGGRTARGGARAALARVSGLVSAGALAGCTGAPAVNVVGSFFPAWMLCGLIGIASAVVFRQLLVSVGLEDGLVAPLLTHALVAVAVTLAVWLLWFGH